MKPTLLALIVAVVCAVALTGCVTYDAPPDEASGEFAGRPDQF